MNLILQDLLEFLDQVVRQVETLPKILLSIHQEQPLELYHLQNYLILKEEDLIEDIVFRFPESEYKTLQHK